VQDPVRALGPDGGEAGVENIYHPRSCRQAEQRGAWAACPFLAEGGEGVLVADVLGMVGPLAKLHVCRGLAGVSVAHLLLWTTYGS